MNNIMLFAGESTKDLEKFLEDRGSITVSYAYPNLFSKEATLRNKLHSVDKLVYVYQDESMNVRQDMRVLKSLFISDSFFKADSVLFLIHKTENYEENIKYFKTTITEIGERAEVDASITSPKFHIVTSAEKFKYDIIYKEILGGSDSGKVKNTRKKLYRVERGSESNQAFEPGNYQNQSVLPYTFDRLNRHNSLSNTAIQADAGQMLVDSADRVIPTLDDPYLGKLEFFDIRQKHRIVVVSGIPKSGATTFSTALSASFMSINQRVLVLDMKKVKSIYDTLMSYDILTQVLSVKELLVSPKVSQFQSVSVIDDFMFSVRFNLLAHIIDNINRLDTRNIILDVSLEDLPKTLEMLGDFVVNTFVLTSPISRDIEEVSEITAKNSDINIILSNIVPYNNRFDELSPDEIKVKIRSLSEKSGLLYKPILFEDMELDGMLVSNLLGVKV